MLAGIALILGTVRAVQDEARQIRLGHRRADHLAADVHPDRRLAENLRRQRPKVGFLAHASKYQAALDEGKLLAPAKSIAQMQQVIFNDYLDASLCGFFVIVVLSVLVFGVRTVLAARANDKPTAKESPVVLMPQVQ
jgi:carbon starvation protein CstA